jgi:cytochrome c-type biogenesis protein CcmH/NrfF
MSRWKSSILLLALSSVVLAQSEADLLTNRVQAVGKHLSCQCGSCSDNVNCMMSSGQCGFCKPARTKIAQMQKSGASDQSIIDTFIKEYGPSIYRANPSAYGWLVPYAVLLAGLGAIVLFLRRAFRPAAAIAPAAPIDDAELAKYRDRIDQDLARLDG